MPELPTGTVTFLFTDVEGSTRLWQEHPAAMPAALARHDAILREAVESHDGHVFKTVGDACHASFLRAVDALAAALQAQQALQAEPWGETGPLRVRMALHAGDAEERDGDYVGQPLNRTARILDAAHGGQVLLSLAASELARDRLPPDVTLVDRGERRLRDLTRPERIFQVQAAGLQADFPPLRTLDTYSNNLPLQLTSFIGREREMAEVKRLLGTTRLLTLTGVGGCGKTRLALQVATDLLDEHPDGVWVVELAPLTDPSLVAQTAAQVLGVREQGSQPILSLLADYLKPRQLLLIFDNCEHLIEPCVQLADVLLRKCPALTILATSREALGIGGEVSWRVPSLSSPLPERLPPLTGLDQYEAVRLFVDRALAVRPSFAVTSDNAPAVAQICWRLDGIPLAIELAAVRLVAMSVEQIAAHLTDRFRLLTGGSRTALRRQQTLRAAIDWSHNLLSESERLLFRRLAVFVGGSSLGAARRVCVGDGVEPWEVLDFLTGLVRKSLVAMEERAGQARFVLVETIREYALERLFESGEGEAVRQRHAEHYTEWADRGFAKMRANDPRELAGRSPASVWGRFFLSEMEDELPDLRAALRWCIGTGQGELGLRLATPFASLCASRGHVAEGLRSLAELLSLPGASGHTEARAAALAGLAQLARMRGDHSAARRLDEESLGIFQELGDTVGAGDVLRSLAWTSITAGDYVQAVSLSEQALTIARKSRNRGRVRLALYALGAATHAVGDNARARAILEEVLASSEFADALDIAARARLGHLLASQGDCRGAAALFTRCLLDNRELGYRRQTASGLTGMARVASRLGWRERAARLFGAAEALLESGGEVLDPDQRTDNEPDEAAARAALGEAAWAAACAEGRAMTLEQAVEYALAENPAGRPGS